MPSRRARALHATSDHASTRSTSLTTALYAPFPVDYRGRQCLYPKPTSTWPRPSSWCAVHFIPAPMQAPRPCAHASAAIHQRQRPQHHRGQSATRIYDAVVGRVHPRSPARVPCCPAGRSLCTGCDGFGMLSCSNRRRRQRSKQRQRTAGTRTRSLLAVVPPWRRIMGLQACNRVAWPVHIDARSRRFGRLCTVTAAWRTGCCVCAHILRYATLCVVCVCRAERYSLRA
jgi:hypothetical protein